MLDDQSATPLFLISRTELFAFAVPQKGTRKGSHVFELRLSMTGMQQDGQPTMRHGSVRWRSPMPWSRIRKVAQWLVGQSLDPDPATLATSIAEMTRAAEKLGLPAKRKDTLAELLFITLGGGATADTVSPHFFDNLERMTHAARFRLEAIEQRACAGLAPVEISRTLCMRCNTRNTQPDMKYLYHLQLDLSQGGMRTSALSQWHASTGWPRLESAAKALQGKSVAMLPGQAISTAMDFMQLARREGMQMAEARALFAGLIPALKGLIDGDPVPPIPSYPDILPSISRYACFPVPPLPTWHGRDLNVYEGVTYMHPLGGNGTKGHLVEKQALSHGLDTIRFNKGTFIAFDKSGGILNFKWSRSPISSGTSLALCTHKEGTRACLARHGVPVPHGRMFMNGDFATATEFANRIGYPVVCKPAAGVRGIGVVANIQNEEELREAFRQYSNSKLGSDDFIIEKHVRGKDYRIIVIDGVVIAAILREPATVTGDGHSNIAELVMLKNSVRRLNPHLWPRPVKYDDAMRYQLDKAGLKLTSVPEEGQIVALSNSCSLSQGGDSIDVLDEMHDSIKAASAAATAAIPGLRYCGVDFLLEDHTRPIEGQEAGICELNAHAAIGNCEYPMFGKPREVARTFFLKSAETFGVEISEQPAERLCLRLEIRGKVTGVGFRRWIERYAKRFNVTGTVRNLTSRKVEAFLCGDTAPVTAMAAAAVLGPARALPTSVRTTNLPLTEYDGFRILETPADVSNDEVATHAD